MNNKSLLFRRVFENTNLSKSSMLEQQRFASVFFNFFFRISENTKQNIHILFHVLSKHCLNSEALSFFKKMRQTVVAISPLCRIVQKNLAGYGIEIGLRLLYPFFDHEKYKIVSKYC